MKTLLTVFSLILISCGHMPEKPTVEIGTIDYPRDEIITAIANGEEKVKSSDDLKYEKVMALIHALATRKPLSAYDKAICFTPPNWELVQNYIHELEDELKNRGKN